MIVIDKLNFDYSDKKNVINDVSFTIRPGEKIGLVGPNGAGKTTLFHLLCGILKPKSGSIMVNDKEVMYNSFNPNVGFVFQNPDDQLFNARVYDDVAFGPYNLKLSRSEVEQRVNQAMDLTGCSEWKERPSHHLSGGEKRMVAIASVIAMQPKVMIYDEPSSNLDIKARRKVISFINKGAETSFIASHDFEFIMETCSRIILLNHGKIIEDAPCKEVFNNRVLLEENDLEQPYSFR